MSFYETKRGYLSARCKDCIAADDKYEAAQAEASLRKLRDREERRTRIEADILSALNAASPDRDNHSSVLSCLLALQDVLGVKAEEYDFDRESVRRDYVARWAKAHARWQDERDRWREQHPGRRVGGPGLQAPRG